MSLVNDILIKSKRSNMFCVRLIACLTGQIISMQAVFGNVVRIMTRFLYFCVETRASWNSKVLLSENAIQEVLFWSESIKSLNCSDALFRNIDLSETRDFELFSDASDVGYGGYINPTVQRSDKSSSQQGGDIVLQKDRVTVSGSWSQEECNKSSTWRELESVHRIINTHSDDLKGSSLVVYSDIKNVSHIL